MVIMWLKQCHKPPIWEWFIPPIHGEIGDGLLLFYQHYWEMVYNGNVWDHNNLMESLCDLNGIVMLMGNRAISKTPSPRSY
jgi:hypothetical protein